MNWSAAEVADGPPGPVTVTSTVPAASAGLVAVISVAETITWVAAIVPKSTAVAVLKPVPMIVTEVPPAIGPAAGLTAVTVGAARAVNWSAEEVVETPPGPVTVMSTVPAGSTGLMAVICVDETTTTLVAGVVPKSTTGLPLKPVPVIVTALPPNAYPVAGLTPVTVGAGTNVN